MRGCARGGDADPAGVEELAGAGTKAAACGAVRGGGRRGSVMGGTAAPNLSERAPPKSCTGAQRCSVHRDNPKPALESPVHGTAQRLGDPKAPIGGGGLFRPSGCPAHCAPHSQRCAAQPLPLTSLLGVRGILVVVVVLLPGGGSAQPGQQQDADPQRGAVHF